LAAVVLQHPHAISVLAGGKKVHLPLPCLLLDLLHHLTLKNYRSWKKRSKKRTKRRKRKIEASTTIRLGEKNDLILRGGSCGALFFMISDMFSFLYKMHIILLL
jgi:hypothetical protein